MYNNVRMKNIVIIVPQNDPEAILISQLAEKLGLPVIKSRQAHGASVDKGRDFVAAVKEGGYKRVVIVEMPGLKTESELKKSGVKVEIIDHHNYDELDRAHDTKTGKLLPSSLEQFLKKFRIDDKKLKALGFNPLLVRGTGALDRGFIWALQKEEFSKEEIKQVLTYQKSLTASVREIKDEAKKDAVAQQAWEKREKWQDFFIVTDSSAQGLRGRVSFVVAEERGEPTPLIIVEKKRGFIYVQESDYAKALLRYFGGFTFGMDRNWGYRNMKGKKRVSLEKVKAFLQDSLVSQ